MDNLINETIEKTYKDGCFEIIIPESKTHIIFEIDDNGKICIESSENIYDNQNKDYSEKSKIRCLSMIVCGEIFMSDGTFKRNKIILKSSNKNIDINTKIKVINKLYNVYSILLDDNKQKLKQIINSDNLCLTLENNYLSNIKKFDDIESNDYDINTIKNLINSRIKIFYSSLRTAQSIKKMLCEAKSDLELFNATTAYKKFFDDESNTSHFTKGKINLEELNKINCSYELLNATNYKSNPAIGRENIIRQLGSILLTPSFSPILIGHPGVGKTSIVNGLCYAIENGKTSLKLFNKKILKISSSSIVSGCSAVGQLEEKMKKIINFLVKNKNIILFIDEMHTAVGAGAGSKSNIDIISILKPYIENGSIKVIGATTTEYYDTILKNDSSFTSRFNIIKVEEPSDELLKYIVKDRIINIENQTNIKFAESEFTENEMIDFLIDLTKSASRNQTEKRYNPRLILSIIEEAFGYASYDCENIVGIKNLSEAINNCYSIYKESRDKKIKQLSLFTNDNHTEQKKQPIKLY